MRKPTFVIRTILIVLVITGLPCHGEEGEICGCYGKRFGLFRIVDDPRECKRWEEPICWSGESVEELRARIESLEETVSRLVALLEGVSREGNNIMLSRVNVRIVNGTGSTDGEVNGLGNLIVGYNERGDGNGSHNMVIGMGHNYSSYGGLVAGNTNTISAPFATVTGGYSNRASDTHASVGGGVNNEASGSGASVGGGYSNRASGELSTISGGYSNKAPGGLDTVSGERPAYDSGWVAIGKGKTLTLPHNLGGDPDNYIVDLQFYDDDEYYGRNQRGYGMYEYDDEWRGACWFSLTDEEIKIERREWDFWADRIRVRIWVNN